MLPRILRLLKASSFDKIGIYHIETQGRDFCGEPEPFYPAQFSKFTRHPHSRLQVKFLTVFLSRVSLYSKAESLTLRARQQTP